MASVDELRALPWAQLIAEAQTSACDDLHSALMKWMCAEGKLSASDAALWRLIEPVLGLYVELDPDAERPFFPTHLLDSIPKDLLTSLATLADELTSNDLRARILDLAWLCKACDYKRVADCVSAYLQSANEQLDPSDWLHACGRLKRALEVGGSIGRQHQPFLDAVAEVERVLDSIAPNDPLWLSHRLMLLLLRSDAGDPTKYATMSHSIVVTARAKYESVGVGNGLQCERERGYLDLEISWRRKLNDAEGVRLLHIQVADAFVRQAEGIVTAGWPNAKSVATHFIECAIERLRQVGGEATKVDTLRLRLQTLQREAVAEMKAIEFSVDVTEAVKQAKALVSGKQPFQALGALAFAYAPPTLEDLREEVSLSAKDTPFKALIPQSYLGPRGTVLAEHAGIASQDDTTAFELETMRTAHARQASIAMAYFHAAAEQVRVEHGIDTPYFAQLARASAFVPPDRERSWARGLTAGLRGDYELATPILIPQFEHAVRELFVARGIVIATLPWTGAQNEFNLNQLLEHPRAAEVLGDEFVFDLRVLLTEKAGANLRNDVAHGLLAEGGKLGAKIYFWWVCLRFVLVPVILAQHQASTAGTDAAGETPAAPPVADASRAGATPSAPLAADTSGSHGGVPPSDAPTTSSGYPSKEDAGS
jgi:hypothetical protein